jgi:hypothetical protein
VTNRRGNDDGNSRPGRGSANAVAHPRITVVQSAEEADPAALDDVLEILVKWAIRAHQARGSGADDAVSGDVGHSYGTGN